MHLSDFERFRVRVDAEGCKNRKLPHENYLRAPPAARFALFTILSLLLPMSSTKVSFGNLNFYTTEEELTAYLKDYDA